jgi:hypothetical protein
MHPDVHLPACRHEHELVVGRKAIHHLLQTASNLWQRVKRCLAVVDENDDPHRIAGLCTLLRSRSRRRSTQERNNGGGK